MASTNKETIPVEHTLEHVGVIDRTAAKNVNDMVRIKVDVSGSQSDMLYVCVNGRSYHIPVDEVVEVPYFIAEIIENSARQDKETKKRIHYLSSKGTNS